MNLARMHFERVMRSFSRLQEHAASDQAYDDLMHFFEDCWHLKDHIKLCLGPSSGQKLEQAIKYGQHPSLSVIADLANKSKHVVLNKNNRVDATVTHKHIHVYDGSYSLPSTLSTQSLSETDQLMMHTPWRFKL